MEKNLKNVLPHPQFLEFLFAFKRTVSAVFKDILGLYDIHHFAVTRINKFSEIITLSSTPAMEYNLFSSPLWHYDKSYNPQWANCCVQAHWQELYKPSRFDELYYLKQIKHNLPIGVSLATQRNEDRIIYSLASHKSCLHTLELFTTQQDEFNKIGHYCSSLLSSLFDDCESKRSRYTDRLLDPAVKP